MKRTSIVLLIISILVISLYSFSNKSTAKSMAIVYTCLPCGADCDSAVYDKPGTCSHCNMNLVDKSTIVHKNIEPDKMCSPDEKNVVFLDVRTVAEFNGNAPDKFGAIKNAINIPVQELESRMGELEKYKDKEIIVYCSHSHRSPRASYMLTQNGFKNVTNMLGGMSVWKERVKKNECNERLYQQQ
ncbi:MAG: rhodanese-like domain-containing protein [Bacteroidetes bacterium]|nr:MAG: rhodanese-like domain-containing protein [Bacteroidota bacterium]